MEYKGEVPRGYNVHHKKPIFRCESNEDPNKLENLELLPDEYHSKKIKNYIGTLKVSVLMQVVMVPLCLI